MPRPHLLCAAAIATTGALAMAAAPASAQFGGILKPYDLRMSVSMKSTFAFQPDPTGCASEKPLGESGAGEEILELRSPKPVRVQLYTPLGSDPVVSRKDLKGGYDVVGESRRTGDFTHVICGESHPGHAAGCVGRFPARQKLALDFFGGTWQASAMSGPTTREVVPSCTDDAFDWDGAVARTGIMLLEPAKGAAVRSKLKAKSFTLVARYVENCDATFFGAGTCKTEWTYKANFRKAGKKKRRH